MDPLLLLSGLGLLASTVFSAYQLYVNRRVVKAARNKELFEQMNGPAARDAIIIGSTERALGVLERALLVAAEDAERLRKRIAELETMVDALRRELAIYKGEVRGDN